MKNLSPRKNSNTTSYFLISLNDPLTQSITIARYLRHHWKSFLSNNADIQHFLESLDQFQPHLQHLQNQLKAITLFQSRIVSCSRLNSLKSKQCLTTCILLFIQWNNPLIPSLIDSRTQRNGLKSAALFSLNSGMHINTFASNLEAFKIHEENIIFAFNDSTVFS